MCESYISALRLGVQCGAAGGRQCPLTLVERSYRAARHRDRYWPASDPSCTRLPDRMTSDLCLLRHCWRIIDLDAEVPDRAFELPVAQEQLDSPQVCVRL